MKCATTPNLTSSPYTQNDDRFERLRLDDSQQRRLVDLSGYFRSFDKDNSGVLDRKEFEQLCKSMEAGGYNLKRLNFRMDALDKNGDGQINFNEFINYFIGLGALDTVDGTRPTHG